MDKPICVVTMGSRNLSNTILSNIVYSPALVYAGVVTMETTNFSNTSIGILLHMDKPICVVTLEIRNLHNANIGILLHKEEANVLLHGNHEF